MLFPVADGNSKKHQYCDVSIVGWRYCVCRRIVSWSPDQCLRLMWYEWLPVVSTRSASAFQIHLWCQGAGKLFSADIQLSADTQVKQRFQYRQLFLFDRVSGSHSRFPLDYQAAFKIMYWSRNAEMISWVQHLISGWTVQQNVINVLQSCCTVHWGCLAECLLLRSRSWDKGLSVKTSEVAWNGQPVWQDCVSVCTGCKWRDKKGAHLYAWQLK